MRTSNAAVGGNSHLSLLPEHEGDGFSWSVLTNEGGSDRTFITVPRNQLVLDALRAFRTDLRLSGLTGKTLTFEVLDAA